MTGREHFHLTIDHRLPCARGMNDSASRTVSKHVETTLISSYLLRERAELLVNSSSEVMCTELSMVSGNRASLPNTLLACCVMGQQTCRVRWNTPTIAYWWYYAPHDPLKRGSGIGSYLNVGAHYHRDRDASSNYSTPYRVR